jgi:hypothetical protein
MLLCSATMSLDGSSPARRALHRPLRVQAVDDPPGRVERCGATRITGDSLRPPPPLRSAATAVAVPALGRPRRRSVRIRTRCRGTLPGTVRVRFRWGPCRAGAGSLAPMRDVGAAEAARGLAEGDRLVVVRAARRAGHPEPQRARSPIGWPDRIPVTVQAATDEGLDVLGRCRPGAPAWWRGGRGAARLLGARPAGRTHPLRHDPGDRVQAVRASTGCPCLEAAYGRLDGPFSAWRAGGVPVTRFWRRGAWDRWRRQVRRGWRRRRERWTEWLRIGPVDVSVDTGLLTLGPLVVATGLVRYLKDPAEGTETELEEAVSSLLNELLEDALGDAVPLVEMLSDVSFEVTSPRSVRLVGYAVFDVGDFELRLRPFMADLARPPATSALYLAGRRTRSTSRRACARRRPSRLTRWPGRTRSRSGCARRGRPASCPCSRRPRTRPQPASGSRGRWSPTWTARRRTPPTRSPGT